MDVKHPYQLMKGVFFNHKLMQMLNSNMTALDKNTFRIELLENIRPYFYDDVAQKIIDIVHPGFMFGNGSFYGCKPTAIYFDPYMRQKAENDVFYVPQIKMIYAEFNDYEEFSSKEIYENVFQFLYKVGKTWKDLNYAIHLDYQYDMDEGECTIGVSFSETKQRDLKLNDYKTNTILFGFSVDFNDYESNRYGNDDVPSLCHKADVINIQCIFWCGIPYSEGSAAVGNFFTHIVYTPKWNYFGLDGDCG
jgi:hypothetical protein